MSKVSHLSALVLMVTFVAACSAAPTATSAPTSAPAATATVAADSGAATPAPAATDSAVATPTKFNLNTASADDFRSIPGMSQRMVREFNEYRPYISILQFRREIGKYVDDAQVAAYEEYVFVPVDVNEADSDTLQQLPGVDATIADALIAGRPYASNDAFLTALAGQVSADDAAAAAAYLTTP